MALIFAWSGGLRKRGELDGTPEVDGLRRQAGDGGDISTVECGVMTGDLLAIADKDPGIAESIPRLLSMPLQTTSVSKSDKINLKDLTLPGLEALISDLGKEKYRAGQIMKWIYQHGAESMSEMTNLSKEVRQRLDEVAWISRLEIARVQESSDGTKKILFRLSDGNSVESVIIPGKTHLTLCVSTQAGCRMGCAFCLTAKQGLKRNLLPSEDHRPDYDRKENLPAQGKEINNIVLMGMGEPSTITKMSARAVEIMSSDMGMALSGRRLRFSSMRADPTSCSSEKIPASIWPYH